MKSNIKQPIKISGNRIYLRELLESDVTDRYCAWLNDEQVTKYLETKRMDLESLKKYVREKKEKEDCVFFGIFLKKSKLHIGNIKLEPIDWKKNVATIGMVIGDKYYWGKGLAVEALKLLLEWSYKNINMEIVNLGVSIENKAAIRAYKKAGFKVVEKTPKAYRMELNKCQVNK